MPQKCRIHPNPRGGGEARGQNVNHLGESVSIKIFLNYPTCLFKGPLSVPDIVMAKTEETKHSTLVPSRP